MANVVCVSFGFGKNSEILGKGIAQAPAVAVGALEAVGRKRTPTIKLIPTTPAITIVRIVCRLYSAIFIRQIILDTSTKLYTLKLLIPIVLVNIAFEFLPILTIRIQLLYIRAKTRDEQEGAWTLI